MSMLAGLLICGTFCLKRRTNVCHFHSILFSQGVVGRLKQVKNNVRVLNDALSGVLPCGQNTLSPR